MKTRNLWLTQLNHFGNYDLTVITTDKEAGIVNLRKEFNRAQKERGEYRSSYSFADLLNGGEIRQTEFEMGKVEWL